MDTPDSPTQSPQSPEEEEKGLSDSELLESPDEEDDRVISDSELLNEEEDRALLEEGTAVESRGRHLELEEEDDEVVPDFVSDPEDEEPLGETGGMMGGSEGSPQEREGKEEEERVVNTLLSPDSDPEHVKSLKKDGQDREERYDEYSKTVEGEAVRVNDEEEEYNYKDEEDERMQAEETRRVAAVREMKDDSVSVSRELDEHELDYDEEVPEDPSLPTQEEDEEDTKADEDEDSEDKSNKKKEKKSILPPSPEDSGRTEGSKGPERIRRDSFRDKKKDEDDGEIDEGEIDVSCPSSVGSLIYECQLIC